MKKGLFWWIAAFMVFLMIRLISSHDASFSPEEWCEERSQMNTETGNHVHTRSWQSREAQHCLTYESSRHQSEAACEEREVLAHPTNYPKYNQHWGYIYAKLIEQNRARLTYFSDSLRNELKIESLSRQEQVAAIVSLIQDIPYVLIKESACTNEEQQSGKCLGGQKFGILTGPEFLHSLKGDCDTRSILLYALLEEFGFDTLIMISKQYRHAMIAVNIPATGDCYVYEQKKYYFWETTGKGWQPGMLPPGMQNINYWKIALS